MCGIAGILAKQHLTEAEAERFSLASDLMNHRGPDHKGIFRQEQLLLVHFRLSILDLDPRSHQPFYAQEGQYVMVYNGEVYNYKEVAKQFQLSLQTTSDTEVLLKSFIQAGEDAVKTWNGIFACVIFNTLTNEVFFIRDRFGVKPLYVYENDDFVAFSSEAKVLMEWLPSFELNQTVLSQFIWFGNMTGDAGIVEGMRKLVPGSLSCFSLKKRQWLASSSYWQLKTIEEISISEEDAIEQVRLLLDKAVERQLVADVPIGILLSGGIDSSSLVAFASKHYSGQLDTYSIEYDYNIGGKSELEKASLIAKQYHTNHHEMRVETNDVVSLFSQLVFQYDEPFADPASIPLYQLAKACSASKRVILQGDGGDEMFAGYRRYNVMDQYAFWRMASMAYPLLPDRRWRERMKRISFILSQKNRGNLLAYYLTEEVPYKDPLAILNNGFREEVAKQPWSDDYIKAAELFQDRNRVQQLLFVDTHILLPHRYLEKVDKATMLCSLEARVPYLDNDLAEFALSLPSAMKVRKGEKKYLLKKALEGYVPKDILYGPKRGFDVPFKQWLKTDLYAFAQDHFNSHQLGFLNKAKLQELLEIHRAGKADYGTLLWKSLVLAHWFERFSSKIKA